MSRSDDTTRGIGGGPSLVVESFRGVAHHWFRTLLSTLGIAWGIVSVVVLLAYGEGLGVALERGFEGAVSEGTTVTLMGQTSLQAGGERAGRPVRLTEQDIEAIGELPLIRNVSPEFMEDFPVVVGNQQATLTVRAVAASYGAMRNEAPAPGGRFLNEEDVRLRRRVAFIGHEVQRKLFGERSPVGETIRVGGIPFDIIGVMREKVQLANYSTPDKYCIFIPWTTMSSLTDTTDIGLFVWQATRPDRVAEAERQVRELIAARYRYDPSDRRAAGMYGSAQLKEFSNGLVTGLRLVLLFIGVLTLAIGSVGTMNIMFVNIRERTREIGLRKAVGATRREILTQFLVEGLLTTLTGGVLGIMLASLVVWFVSPQPFLSEILDDSTGATDIHLALSPGLVVLSTSVLAGVGLVSSLLPAVRASRLDPIEALRYE